MLLSLSIKKLGFPGIIKYCLILEESGFLHCKTLIPITGYTCQKMLKLGALSVCLFSKMSHFLGYFYFILLLNDIKGHRRQT